MFMFCRLAMMKEFLFMSGLEEPSYTHPARAPHTHTHSLPTAFAKRDLPDERGSPLLPWWTIGSGGHGLWYVTLILCDIFSSMLILVHVKGFYCSPTAWLWSLLLSFSLFEPYVWPDFPFPHFFFLCGDWDYDVIYSCWGSHARSLLYLPYFPYEKNSTCICCVSDAGVPTKLFN